PADLNGLPSLNPINPNEKCFWLWKPSFADPRDLTQWHSCVADIFDGDIDFSPALTARVMHTILFSPRKSDGEFEEFMKRTIDRLMHIKDGEGQMVIKSIWFGKVLAEKEKLPTDALHAHPLYFDEDVRAKWKYCLSMSLANEKDLFEFLNDKLHAAIRKDIYTFLDPNVGPLYERVDKQRKGDDASANGSGLGDVIEKIMSKHMIRLDYRVPNPFIVYEAIDAVQFEVT
ncbi:MAG: hypothetical protein K2Y05_09725, partial [Hyphomicrobiaceae bacterium]|nr:hypothetical protein [Hyphomicrobiaceae bacterium]